jgi:hypothetical protein
VVSIRGVGPVGLVAALGVIVGLACSGSAGEPAAAATRSSRLVVPVTVMGGQGTAMGARPMVEVRVGRSAPVPLLLDTGSTGLQIFAARVRSGPGSGVTATSRPDQATYAGGHRLAGVVATARIAIGAARTAHPVPFGLVQTATCTPAKPACPVAGGVAAAIARGFSGILGIGTGRGPNGLANPILGMPGRLARSWSLHMHRDAGSLVLGPLPAATSGTRVTVPLTSLGTVEGNRFWDDRIHLCLVVGPAGSCAPGLFDSGTFAMQLPGSRFPGAPVLTGTHLVVPGTTVTVTIRGRAAPFWHFTAGATKSADTVSIRPEVPRLVNTGIQAFYAFTITYDNVHGTIGFLAPAPRVRPEVP